MEKIELDKSISGHNLEGSAVKESIDKLNEKYMAFTRNHKGDREVREFVCCGHEYLEVSEEVREQMKIEGRILDSESGRLTVEWLRELSRRYDACEEPGDGVLS